MGIETLHKELHKAYLRDYMRIYLWAYLSYGISKGYLRDYLISLRRRRKPKETLRNLPRFWDNKKGYLKNYNLKIYL
jgi:hypothetical protein